MKYRIYPLCLLWAFTFSACEYEEPLGFESDPPKVVSDTPMDGGGNIYVSSAEHTIRLTVEGHERITNYITMWKIDGLPIGRGRYEEKGDAHLKMGWVETKAQRNVVTVKIQPNDTGKSRTVAGTFGPSPYVTVVTIHQAAN